MFAPGTLPVTDRVRIVSGGNGMGMVSGTNKSMPTVRPGLQGIVSSSMLNSGSMLSPAVASANVHSVVGSGQGSSLLRPREALHMIRVSLHNQVFLTNITSGNWALFRSLEHINGVELLS